jgi:acetyl-CoA synthetase
VIQFAPGLPKTRSGKIMRRILRKVAEGDIGNLGDTTTLADPSVVDDLVRNRAEDGAPDVITVGGVRMDADEIERVLESHDCVLEAAIAEGGGVVHAYVVVAADSQASDILEADLKGLIRREVGVAAVPATVRFLPALPRSKEGRLVRRILRKAAAGDLANLGDPAQLADPSVLDLLYRLLSRV